MEADFSGYVTKAGLKCSDGRTILPDAFKHQDSMQVPLVWQHGHTDPENVLGHVVLENREDGVYGYGFFNDTPKAQHMKSAVDHKDIRHMSIWANELIERSKRVLHGAIREVSLVLSGANPGAIIDNVTIRHSDGDVDTLDEEAIIHTGLEIVLEHSEVVSDETLDVDASEEEISHAAGEKLTGQETIQDIYDTMTEAQKQVLQYMV
jgi:HK97 family phage prohead protease